MEKITVRQWIEKWKAGEFKANGLSKDEAFDRMCEAGWYDWFCKDKSLYNRLKAMSGFITKITNPYVLDNFYVWFKNNCPCCGPLYDDVRFEPFDEERRDTEYFLVSVYSPHEDRNFALYRAPEFETPAVLTDSRTEIMEYINSIKPNY